MNKRLLLAHLLDRSGAMQAVIALRRRAQPPWLPVLTFHRIHEIGERGAFPFDDGVVDATPREFARQIEMIARSFTPIGIDDLLDFLDGAALPRNPVLVTFDDGYRDNHEVALPILKRVGVKAVFFIATRYVTERRMFWWDRISFVIKHSRRPRLALSYPYPLGLAVHDPGSRALAIETLLRIVKTYVALDLERFLVGLAAAAAVDLELESERRIADEYLMTWKHIRELRAAGMDVQSHTRSHRVLQTLPRHELVEELAGSRQDLERELGAPVCAISYPVGHSIAKLDAVRDALVAAGYKLGFTNATGAVSLRRKVDRFDVSRVSVDRHTPEALFRALLALPPVFD